MVVVGGGAAGLSGAMALGRSKRSVLVIDAGEPRNAPADPRPQLPGPRGRHRPSSCSRSAAPRWRRTASRCVSDRVVGLSGEVDAFLVTTEGGRRFGARRVLVTGGVVDELPDVPGLAERWGIDVLHCPYCHGWEVRDQPIAILATTPMSAHHGLLFRQLSDDVVMVVHDGVELPDEEHGEAGRHRRPVRARHPAGGRHGGRRAGRAALGRRLGARARRRSSSPRSRTCGPTSSAPSASSRSRSR